MQAVALENATLGITCNAVCPGAVATPSEYDNMNITQYVGFNVQRLYGFLIGLDKLANQGRRIIFSVN
jgi:NAD(P)-dependent dehydrogenase (short-subunit alcohol dehydrogenase family)